MWAYNDPFFTDEEPYCNTVRYISEEDIIKYMNRVYPEREYTDEDALYDFVIVNWAWSVEVN